MRRQPPPRQPTRVSQESKLGNALVSHGDLFCFDEFGAREAFLRMTREVGLLRGYTDAFGHAQVLSGGVDAMVDLSLNIWDAAEYCFDVLNEAREVADMGWD